MAATAKTDPESIKSEEAPAAPPCRSNYSSVDVALRGLLFAASVTAVVVMVTAKQTEIVPVPGLPIKVPLEAKFSDSPAFVYFISALSVAGLYGILTALASISIISKPAHATRYLLHFALWDVLMLGIVASATGAAGGVAYIGLKGNSHVGWGKVCNVYDKFCQHVGSSIAVALFASVLLVLLTMLSVFSIYRKIPK
ncbi:hypothetical protein OIU76_014456 [Salix suchowensis]|uniref:CASP-like protein n=1 Tax=Salix suchowensis TaxID=1278906 RepID=A0ABQ8ZZU7_9ROSI|nr:hypothetical protein OIU76_014456 [Salix suchowensis]KAJ6321199.1 hypothetical protein OIU77_011324 [Salix suchowensis]